MAGMGFILSWDLVQWISVSDIPPQNQVTFYPFFFFFAWMLESYSRRNAFHDIDLSFHQLIPVVLKFTIGFKATLSN